MIHELDTVVLVHDLEAYGLTRGDVGAVVHCYKDGMTFEVEFVTGEGATIAVLTLSQQDIRLYACAGNLARPRSRAHHRWTYTGEPLVQDTPLQPA